MVIFDWREHPGTGGGPDTCFGTGVLTSVGDVFNRPEPPHQRLWFAAAEYSTTYTGYVEGAMAAGERVAAEVCGETWDDGRGARNALEPPCSWLPASP